jgi:hypothetical protein
MSIAFRDEEEIPVFKAQLLSDEVSSEQISESTVLSR